MKRTASYLLRFLLGALLAGPVAPPVGATGLLLGVTQSASTGSAAASAATVTPDQITGLRAWWKADTGLTTTSNVAAQFTSANTEYLSAADNAVFPFSGDWTLAAWVKADSFNVGTGNFIAGQWDSGANQISWAVLYNDFSSAKKFSFWTSVDGTNGAIFNATSIGQPAVATWYFIVVKHVASTRTKKIKVNDGTEDSTTYASGSLWNSTARFCIGSQLANNVPGQTWSGQMRAVGWWSRLTTNTEDTWLYNSGLGRVYSNLGQADNGSNLLTNLVVWYNLGEKTGPRLDSSTNTVTLTDNNTVTLSTGPTGAPSNSTYTYVSTWADQSGNGYDLTGATPAKYGIYVANEKNSLPAVQLDGQDSNMRVASLLGLTNGQGRTVAIVYKVPSASNASTIFIQGQSASGTNPWSIDANTQGTAGTKFGFRAGSGATFDLTTACDTNYHLHYVAMSTMAAASAITTNTTYRIDQVGQTLTLVGGSDAFATMAGANFTGLGLFPAATDTQRAASVAEVAVYDHALSTTDRDSLEAYLKTRYGF